MGRKEGVGLLPPMGSDWTPLGAFVTMAALVATGEPMELLDHGERKFPNAALQRCSAGLGWRGIAAELRSHPAGDLAPFQPDQLEITIAIRGDRTAVVNRKGDGVRQATRVEPGAIWISPAGVCEDDIRITRPLADILHLYLPCDPYGSLAAFTGGSALSAGSIRYLAGIRDPLIRQIGLSLLGEMQSPTPAGRVLAESLALALAARLAQSYSHENAPASRFAAERHAIDDTRLRRVLDHMVSHLHDDIGLEDLAGVACLSPFHFSRMFHRKVGMPPHRYLAKLRLEAARDMLLHGDRSLSEIAFACRFSSQSNFTRAFRAFAGATPGEFRRQHGRAG